MIPKSILFYWGKGSKIRRDILSLTNQLNKNNNPCFLNIIAKKIKLSHVATKKHIDLLIEENYLKQINPNGKPVFLKLTKKGKEIIKELKEKSKNI
jgi:DNA-binding MarR family transcriptional regulator